MSREGNKALIRIKPFSSYSKLISNLKTKLQCFHMKLKDKFKLIAKILKKLKVGNRNSAIQI